MSLTARILEEGGISTVIMGSAKDIVEECGVPRFLFTDFPLGNPCGKPRDPKMQSQMLDLALELLSKAFQPRTTIQSPFTRYTDEWRQNYMDINDQNLKDLALAGEQRRKKQKANKDRKRISQNDNH